jgi:hypothetical protein
VVYIYTIFPSGDGAQKPSLRSEEVRTPIKIILLLDSYTLRGLVPAFLPIATFDGCPVVKPGAAHSSWGFFVTSALSAFALKWRISGHWALASHVWDCMELKKSNPS